MSITVNQAWLVAFLLSLVRAGAFMTICPPFSSPAIPARVKSIIGVALALAGASTQTTTSLEGGLPVFVSALVLQAGLGLALGFGVYLFFSAISIAGDLIDISIGFSAAQALDPVTGVYTSISSRLLNISASALMFATGGHLLLVRGFVRAGGIETLNVEALGASILGIVAQMMVAAIEIALPVCGSLLVAEIGLALLGKAAPQLNVFQLGFAVKVLLGVFLLGTSIVLLPEQVSALLERAISFMSGA